MQKKFFKNAQIAKKYGVSRPTVSNWVDAAKRGENNLQLEDINGREYIIDSLHNETELLNLKENSLKYRNKIGYEKLTVKPEFYEIFNLSQQIEIINELENNKRISLKYSYFNGGAEAWDEFVHEMINKDSFHMDHLNILINSSLNYLQIKMQNYDTVNIVDVGSGNGYTTFPIINALLESGKKVKYTGIDLSPKMLKILEENINKKYPNIESKYREIDFENMVMRDDLFLNHINDEKCCNLVLFLGATIGNLPDRHKVLKNFYESMGKDDFLWFNNGLDSIARRSTFTTPQHPLTYKAISWIPNLLGMKESDFSVINKFDESSMSRIQVFKLQKDLDVLFKINNEIKKLSLFEGNEIQVWNHHSHSMGELFNELDLAGFTIDYLAVFPGNTNALVMCEPVRK